MNIWNGSCFKHTIFIVGCLLLMFKADHIVSATELVQRVRMNDVDLLVMQSRWSYFLHIVHDSFQTSWTGLPRHDIAGTNSPTFLDGYSFKNGKHNFPFSVANISEDTYSTYEKMYSPTENSVTLTVTPKNKPLQKVFSARKFMKKIPAKAGKPSTTPTVDFSMTEAADGSVLSRLSVPSAAICADNCHTHASCQFFVFTTKGADEDGNNCSLMKDVKTTKRAQFKASGGNLQNAKHIYIITIEAEKDEIFYGVGGGPQDQGSLSFTSSKPRVGKHEMQSPLYHSSAGYSMLAYPFASEDSDTPSSSQVQWNVTPPEWIASTGLRREVTWTLYADPTTEMHANIFIMPARNLREHHRAVQEVTSLTDTFFLGPGYKVSPPPYAYGLTVSHSGWSSPEKTLEVIQSFRDNSIPMDAIQMDFEWYSPTSDENGGNPAQPEFVYNSAVMPNAPALIKSYKDDYNVVFGGIVKPRLVNQLMVDVARSREWLYENERTMIFSLSPLRDWYAMNISQYMIDGVGFFWNDDLEKHYLNHFHWTKSLIAAKNEFSPDKALPFFVTNGYSIGMQRNSGSVASTGLFDSTWENLQKQVGYLQNWALAGSLFTSVTIGGNQHLASQPVLLTRWYQLGALCPIMRIHTSGANNVYNPVHYSDPYASAMKKAIQLHYQLFYIFYHIGHFHTPSILPIVAHYPDFVQTKTSTEAFMLGFSILVAPIVNLESTVTFFLPKPPTVSEIWYKFGAAEPALTGGKEISLQNVPIDEIPMYVRGGTILLLANAEAKSSKDFVDLPREVHIYSTQSGQEKINLYVSTDGHLYDTPKCKAVLDVLIFDEARRTIYSSQQASNRNDVDICTKFGTFLSVKWFLPNGQVLSNPNWNGNSYKFPTV